MKRLGSVSVRFLALLVLLAAAALFPRAAIAEQALAKLQSGNFVILMRHAQTTPGVGDPAGFSLGDCATQRNLDERGRAQANALREKFEKAGIIIGKALASPWCRCMDTARLIAPEAPLEASVAIASTWDIDDPQVKADRARQARDIMSQWRGPGHLLMVTHGVNLRSIVGRSARQGGFLVVNPATMSIIAEGPDGSP